MAEYRMVYLGTENAFVGSGALKELGVQASKAGTKALAIGGAKAWKAAQACGVEEKLAKTRLPYVYLPFSGYCSQTTVPRIMKAAKEEQCDVLIAFGGGKCMDAVKSAADKLALPCILVPTSCATCASNVRLCVWYDDEGRCVPGMFAAESAYALIVDSDLIITHGDERLFASGMMDALAKYAEIDFSLHETPAEQRSAMLITAQQVARSNFLYILAHGQTAYRDACAKRNTFEAEQMVYMNIMETGLASSLVSGVHQLAIAHMLHDAICSLFHDQRSSHLHGEIVAVGVLMQMRSNGYDAEFIARTESFIRSVNGPVCLRDLDIMPTDENRSRILDYFATHGYGEPEMMKRIEKAYTYINC